MLKAGFIHVVDADLKSYFDTIPKDRLLARVGQKVSDGRILGSSRPSLNKEFSTGLRNGPPNTAPRKGRSAVRC